MAVRATGEESQLINDLLALRNAKWLTCRMTHEELLGCLKLWVCEDNGSGSHIYETSYDPTRHDGAPYVALQLGVLPYKAGAELVPNDLGVPGLVVRIEVNTPKAPTDRHGHKPHDVTIGVIYRHDDIEAYSMDENGTQLHAEDAIAAAIRVARSGNELALQYTNGIATRVLKALF